MKQLAEQFNFMNNHLTETEKITLLLVIEQFHIYRTDHNDRYVRNSIESIKKKLDAFNEGTYDGLKKGP